MNQVMRWDYQASVRKMRPLVIRWKTVTEEMLDELYRAREALAKEGRPKTVSNETVMGWSNYLSDIGLPRATAHRWLEFWNPIEKKRIEPPSRPKREPEPKKSQGRTISDEEYERRKQEAFKEKEPAPSLEEAIEDAQKLLLRQENEEVFREFDLDALIGELRRRIVTIEQPSRRHHAINQIIKAMRELAIECDRLSIGRA